MSPALPDIFGVFEFVFLLFFGIPKSSRNWMLTHPESIKINFHGIKNAHFSSK